MFNMGNFASFVILIHVIQAEKAILSACKVFKFNMTDSDRVCNNPYLRYAIW